MNEIDGESGSAVPSTWDISSRADSTFFVGAREKSICLCGRGIHQALRYFLVTYIFHWVLSFSYCLTNQIFFRQLLFYCCLCVCIIICLPRFEFFLHLIKCVYRISYNHTNCLNIGNVWNRKKCYNLFSLHTYCMGCKYNGLDNSISRMDQFPAISTPLLYKYTFS